MAKRFTSKARWSLTLCGLLLVLAGSARSQEKTPATPVRPSSCSRENALEIIQQQIAFSKTFDNSVQRITVLIRAADLLWVVQRAKARVAYSEAFDLAVRNFKEKGDDPSREGRGLLISTPDQRYTVISAIAKHDASWARELTDQMLKAGRTPIGRGRGWFFFWR